MVLVLCEMQLASSRIWTRVAVSISYDDNHYTTGTSRPGYAIWDVLVPTKKQAQKLAEKYTVIKFFRLQPEYMGSWRMKVTICISSNFPAAYQSKYGRVEEVSTVNGNTGPFAEITPSPSVFKGGISPQYLTFGDGQPLVIMEGRQPLYWQCKQTGLELPLENR